MVDVGDKDVTRRVARAGGRISMTPATAGMIRSGSAAKGDVLGVARIAAIQAAKRTADLLAAYPEHTARYYNGQRVLRRYY